MDSVLITSPAFARASISCISSRTFWYVDGKFRSELPGPFQLELGIYPHISFLEIGVTIPDFIYLFDAIPGEVEQVYEWWGRCESRVLFYYQNSVFLRNAQKRICCILHGSESYRHCGLGCRAPVFWVSPARLFHGHPKPFHQTR